MSRLQKDIQDLLAAVKSGQVSPESVSEKTAQLKDSKETAEGSSLRKLAAAVRNSGNEPTYEDLQSLIGALNAS